MNRSLYQMAVLAALLGLQQAPLCDLACASAAAAVPVAAHAGAPPCHAAGGSGASPPKPPLQPPLQSSNSDCGCDAQYAVPMASLPGPDFVPAAVLPAREAAWPAPRTRHAARADRRHRTDIPPPDILLQKSTLTL